MLKCCWNSWVCLAWGFSSTQTWLFCVSKRASLVNLHSSVKSICHGNWGSSHNGVVTTYRNELGVQNQPDPLHIPSWVGKSVVAAHAEPPRWYYEAHQFHAQWFRYLLMGSLQCDAVCLLQSWECNASLEHHNQPCWWWRDLFLGAVE